MNEIYWLTRLDALNSLFVTIVAIGTALAFGACYLLWSFYSYRRR